MDLDLEADLKAHRRPGREHDGVPDDAASWPAMPCERHTPGLRQTLPSALGPGAVPWPPSTRHAECSWLHPKAPPLRPLGGHRATWTVSCLAPPALPLAQPLAVPLPLPLERPPRMPLHTARPLKPATRQQDTHCMLVCPTAPHIPAPYIPQVTAGNMREGGGGAGHLRLTQGKQ